MSYVQPHDAGRKSFGLIGVILFHIALGFALKAGLGTKIVELVQAPLETALIEEVKPPKPDKPPPPPPKMAAPPPPFIPAVEVNISNPMASANAITAVSTNKPVAEAPVPRPAPVGPQRTSAVVDARNCTKPEYPPQSLRAQEEGLVVLRFLIGADGTAIESGVEKSSGFRRLDEAARRALALCKFKPGTEEGKVVQSWARIEYQWKIEE